MAEIRIATKKDKDFLVALVGEYHSFESIDSSIAHRQKALSPLLVANASVGFILVAESKCKIVGYISICFSYSIEFGGRDGFIDEFYLVDSMRNQGIGSRLIEMAKVEAAKKSIRVLHLEVARDNGSAKKLYQTHGFNTRKQFQLMSCVL